MKWFLLLLSISSLVMLYFALKSKFPFHWLRYVTTNIVLAAILVYFINFTGIFTEFRIPINITTTIVIAILGIPGLLLVAALKLTLL